MRITVMIAMVLLVLTAIGLAQAPDTAWTRLFNRHYEQCFSIDETYDGGYVLVGESYASDQNFPDILLIKINQDGDSLWSHLYCDTILGREAACIKETPSDSGFVIAGWKHMSSSLRYAYILKTDSNGDTLWSTLYGDNRNTYACYVNLTNDGGYIVTGRRYVSGNFADVLLLKLDADGNQEWVGTYGDGYYQDGKYVQQTSDGGYILAGSSDNADNYDYYLIKTFADGMVDWSRTYGVSGYDMCPSAQQTIDGGYILYGLSNSLASGYAVKTNSIGDTLWTKVYAHSSYNIGYSVRQTDDGGYIFGGFSNNTGYRDDFWFVRADANGDTLWTKTVGFGEDQRGYCVIQSSDGGYILVGESPNGYDAGDFYVVKLNAEATPVKDIDPIPSSFAITQNYPNPFNADTKIQYSLTKQSEVELIIYDVLGRQIESLVNEQQPAGYYSIDWDASSHPSGLYFARLKTDDNTESIKMVLLK